MIQRNKLFYVGTDRIHSYKESAEKDKEIKGLLEKYKIDYSDLNWKDETIPVEDIEKVINIDKS